MGKTTLILSFLLATVSLYAQKQPVTHNNYDSWKSIKNISAPQNGDVLLYYTTPQEGDNLLNIYNTQTEKLITIPRGSNAAISQDNSNAVAIIKPYFTQTREAKIKKTKSEDMPKDTLAIIDLLNNKTIKIPNYKSHSFPNILTNYIAYQETGEKDEQDNVYVLNIVSKKIDTLKNVDKYSFLPNSEAIVYTTKYVNNAKNRENLKKGAKDTTILAKFGYIDTTDANPGLYIYEFPLRTKREIIQGPKGSKFYLPSYYNNTLSFYANTDTTKDGKNNNSLYLYNIKEKTLNQIANNKTNGVPNNWILNNTEHITFSQNGERIIFGLSPKPREKDTTLVEFEQPQLDIWSWHDDYNQPQQLLNRNKELNKTYQAYINITNPQKVILIGDSIINQVNIPNNGNSNLVLVSTNKKYRYQTQWNVNTPRDLYIIDLKTGKREKVLEEVNYIINQPSPSGRYYPLFNEADGNWLLYDITTKKLTNLTKDLKVKFYDIDHDTPSLPGSYGRPTWFADESGFILPTKYDLWQFSPNNSYAPFPLTEGKGEKNNITYTIANPYDYSIEYNTSDIAYSNMNNLKPGVPIYFSTFNHITKEHGYSYKEMAKKGSKIIELTEEPYSFANPTLAGSKNPSLYYLKGNFNNPMDLWVTKDKFKHQKQLTDINPQQRDLNWGNVQLVNWLTADSIKAEGLLFTPENLDPNQKYPMIIYFYEKNSETIYNYRQPAPSRSTINIPYFVSNGYIVFVPDIYYKTGEPGESAMRSIMPAVEMLEKTYPWINGDKIGIQGQSWGGYQVAYMITKTNKFKAAGAGAPVSNMTSAYGGIRWSSGMTRQFQYEQTQSRIGKTLWDGFEEYYNNSPLFFLPNVNTPVLIMHNDKDGAVPWYQGIEMFTGLKRLGKEAWLLQYNNEEHNLTQRRNSKDLSIRLEQFFNHYLKGAPAPKWMKEGRPATDKGFSLGYELIK